MAGQGRAACRECKNSATGKAAKMSQSMAETAKKMGPITTGKDTRKQPVVCLASRTSATCQVSSSTVNTSRDRPPEETSDSAEPSLRWSCAASLSAGPGRLADPVPSSSHSAARPSSAAMPPPIAPRPSANSSSVNQAAGRPCATQAALACGTVIHVASRGAQE